VIRLVQNLCSLSSTGKVLCHSIQIGSGTYPASYTVLIWSLLSGVNRPLRELATHLLVPEVMKTRAHGDLQKVKLSLCLIN
jgi:hypothetical protein